MPYIPRSTSKPKNYSERPAFANQHKTDNSKFYQSRKWRKVRKSYIQQHPLCRVCELQGRTRPATVVDHIKPISEGGEMWDENNFQALCAQCHNIKSGKEGARAAKKKRNDRRK